MGFGTKMQRFHLENIFQNRFGFQKFPFTEESQRFHKVAVNSVPEIQVVVENK